MSSIPAEPPPRKAHKTHHAETIWHPRFLWFRLPGWRRPGCVARSCPRDRRTRFVVNQTGAKLGQAYGGDRFQPLHRLGGTQKNRGEPGAPRSGFLAASAVLGQVWPKDRCTHRLPLRQISRQGHDRHDQHARGPAQEECQHQPPGRNHKSPPLALVPPRQKQETCPYGIRYLSTS